MTSPQWHRRALVAPFAVLLLGTVVGGQLNRVDAHGRIVDAATGKAVDTPEARQPADTQIGKGTVSGVMVVGPYPSRDAPVLICAKNYKSQEVTPKGYQQGVQLTATEGSDCPPLKSPPPPAQSPTPSPGASAVTSATGAPSASKSP